MVDLPFMLKKNFLTILCLYFFATGFTQTKVCLIHALHGLHKTNNQYSYDSLKAIITRMHPDVIAVEIRAEDVASDTAYLKKNYPYEMWMMQYWFPSATIEGFDWLGTELEGKAIPDRYWKDQSKVKTLERLLDGDSVYSSKANQCQTHVDERMTILKNNSLQNILQSKDASLTKAYYNCLDLQLQGSDYAELTRFYTARNEKMQERLSALVEKYPNKTIVVLTGDDHYPYLLEHLQKQNIVLVQPY
jgi:hypothetical protein